MSRKDYQPGQPCQPDRQNGVWIMQAEKWGKYVGRGDFTYRNGEVTLASYQLIPVNLKHKIKNLDGSESWLTWQEEIPKNTAMMKLLTPFQKRAEATLQVNVGRVNGVFSGEKETVRVQQSSLGQLILRAQMAATQADFAVMSGGGIRASLKPGPVAWRDLLQVQPFANQVVSVTLSGAEIKRYLAVVANIEPGSGGYAQFANVSLTANGSGVSKVTINGQPLDDTKTYRMATNSFNAAGGDGYPRIDSLPGYVNSGNVDAVVLRDWVSKHSPLNASDYVSRDKVIYQTATAQDTLKDAKETVPARRYPKMILAWIQHWNGERAAPR